MINLRKFARNQPCTVRAPGICNFDETTTILAHIRRRCVGIGTKPCDLAGIHACSQCHDLIDGRLRHPEYPLERIDTLIVGALCETLDRVSKELK